MDTHRMSQQIAQQWQHFKSSLQHAWDKLMDEGSPRSRGHSASALQEDYLRRRDEEDRKNTTVPEEKKDLLQKASEVNGNMKLNQYVANPAPGPSQRHGPQGENEVRDEQAEKRH